MNFHSVAEQRKMSAEVRAGRPTMPTIPHSKRPTILIYPTGKDKHHLSNTNSQMNYTKVLFYYVKYTAAYITLALS